MQLPVVRPEVISLLSLVTSISAVVAIFLKPVKAMKSMQEGQKCLLRSQMLAIYYDAQEKGNTIRQFQFENFCYLYAAYKALGGNSFIEKINEEVRDMKVVN